MDNNYIKSDKDCSIADLLDDVSSFLLDLQCKLDAKINNNVQLNDFDLFILDKLLYIQKQVIDYEKDN